VLNSTENAPDHDQAGRNVQNVHMPSPRKLMCTGQLRIRPRKTEVEEACNHDKESKEGQLEKQTNHDDLLAGVE
ncbi:hypothetical protein N0V87_010676, partial [Didymella glomerata]